MPIFKRPEAELCDEGHGSGFPLLLFAPGDTPHPAKTGAEIASLAPNSEVQKDWRGPTHLKESIRRVGELLTRNTPA